MTSLIDHFDHFVVPVDDIVAAEAFYTDVLGARVAVFRNGEPMRLGLSVRQFTAGFRPHTFFVIAGKRIGVYLQFEARPNVERVFGGPTYSFEATAAGLERVASSLEARQLDHEGPLDDDRNPAARSLFFNDPAGNHYHLYVPADRKDPASATDGDLTAIGYLRLEAPDLEESIRFYTETFGLEVQARSRNQRLDAREATIRLPSGQLLFLTELPYSPKGIQLGWDVPGPHLAFYVPSSRWETLYNRLSALGVQHGDILPDVKGRRPNELDTYMSDPAGYRVQLVAEGEH